MEECLTPMQSPPTIVPLAGRPDGSRSRTYTSLLFAGLLCLLATTGCSLGEWVHNKFKVGPNYSRPPAPVAPVWSVADEKGVLTEPTRDCGWWMSFNDPTLNWLIETAYRQNLDLPRRRHARAGSPGSAQYLGGQPVSPIAKRPGCVCPRPIDREPEHSRSQCVQLLGHGFQHVVGAGLLGPLPPQHRGFERRVGRPRGGLRRYAGPAVFRSRDGVCPTAYVRRAAAVRAAQRRNSNRLAAAGGKPLQRGRVDGARRAAGPDQPGPNAIHDSALRGRLEAGQQSALHVAGDAGSGAGREF